MKRRTLSLACALAVVGVASLVVIPHAKAGYKGSYPVSVYSNPSDGAGAQGSVGDTRNSGDTSSWIYCGIQGYPGQAIQGFCSANNAANQSATCYTSDPGLIQVIASMKGDSNIAFSAATNYGNCTYVESGTGSYFAPKLP